MTGSVSLKTNPVCNGDKGGLTLTARLGASPYEYSVCFYSVLTISILIYLQLRLMEHLEHQHLLLASRARRTLLLFVIPTCARSPYQFKLSLIQLVCYGLILY